MQPKDFKKKRRKKTVALGYKLSDIPDQGLANYGLLPTVVNKVFAFFKNNHTHLFIYSLLMLLNCGVGEDS